MSKSKSKPPTISSLLPGMLVVLRSDVMAVVTLVHDRGKARKVLRSERGFVYELTGYKANLRHNSTVTALDIVQVCSLQNWNGELHMEQYTLENRKVIWEEKGYSIKKLAEWCEETNFSRNKTEEEMPFGNGGVV